MWSLHKIKQFVQHKSAICYMLYPVLGAPDLNARAWTEAGQLGGQRVRVSYNQAGSEWGDCAL